MIPRPLAAGRIIVRKFNIRDFSWYGAMELLAIRLNAGLGKIKSK